MYTKESAISNDRAKRILEATDNLSDYDPMGDYYVTTTEAGVELLTQWGIEGWLVINHGETSWLGSW